MEEDKKFYDKIVLPMMGECTTGNHFRIDEKEKEKSDAELLCVIVKKMENYLVQLNDNQQISTHISSLVKIDRNELLNKYMRFLQTPNDLARQIRQKIVQIGQDEKNMIPAFKKSYEEFKTEVMEKPDNRCDTIECQKSVYELLFICIRMFWLSIRWRWNDEDKRALAYKQFTINLTIHSLQLANHPKSADGKRVLEGIQKHVASWMKIEGLNNLDGISAQFYTIIIVPLVKKICNWHFGYYFLDAFGERGGKKLCETVKHLSNLFFKLDGIYKMTKNGEKNPAQEVDNMKQIHHLIMLDVKFSNQICRNMLSKKESEPIDEEISKIPKTRVDLNVAFEQAFYQLIGELKKEEENSIGKYRTIGNNTLPFARKLLRIGEEMEHLYSTSFEEKIKWAYQQFAADLALYSHRIYMTTISADGNEIREDIRKIAENWMQIGMVDEAMTKTNLQPAIGKNNEDH
jgi:hypothetical protein